jgi:hypothetical protein
MNNNEIYLLNSNIKNLISSKFIKLNTSDKEIICINLFKTCDLLAKYYYNENFINQLFINNMQDIMSLLVLLIPFYELDTSHMIGDLNEIFNNSKKNAKKDYSSTYYCDHMIINKNDIHKYFDNSLKLIDETLKKSAFKLLTNWLNIFPYTMSDYRESDIYKNMIYCNKTHNFKIDNFLLNYNTLYGVMVNFLYNDIKKIKWMIYDIIYNNQVIPTIIYISEKINISEINNYVINNDFFNSKEYINSLDLWNNLSDSDLKNFSSLILFYSNFNKPKYSAEIKSCIEKNFPNLKKDIDEDENNEEDIYENISNLNELECIKLIKSNIDFKYLYTYIFQCVQQFKYTWYSNKCLNINQNIYNIDEFFEEHTEYIDKYCIFKDEKKKYYITFKTYYNYFKRLIHCNGKIFKQYSNSYDWDSLTQEAKTEIIKKLNDNRTWFSITGVIGKLYTNDLTIDTDIKNYMTEINNKIYINDYIVIIIFETLVLNGILTKFVFNPINTNAALMPDKNKDNKGWEKHLKSNLFTHNKNNNYHESYSFLNNKRLDQQKLIEGYPDSNIKYSCLDTIKNSIWYKGFGGDWICQIQQYHRFIHNRVMLVTGATGAGKSTIFPFIMLYAYKIINYNNNSKIICTAPRHKPVKDNAARIARSLGTSIVENEINQIQYYTGIYKTTSDDEYHPTLRFVTDGSFVKSLLDNYILKIIDSDDNKNKKKKEKKICENYIDMLLVDESHENNTYITFLLTLVKFSIYINNSVSLGIISATMEYDELIYRLYYKVIDDNYKYPLNLFNKDNEINRNLLDRRVHLSKPFLNTNFTITEIPYKENKSKMTILKEILGTSSDGDILIFESGSAEVKKTANEINKSQFCPRNTIALPYYSEINQKLKNILDNIARPDVRKNYRFPKTYNIIDYGIDGKEFPESQLLPEGYYTRFIIVATNIIEASVTIDSLKYVIDTGTHKKNIYDIKTRRSILKETFIAIQNKTQRKGRVGRVQPGFFYQTYDKKNLKERGNYLICTDNIINNIIEKITSRDNVDKDFDNIKDPYKIKDIKKLLSLPYIATQYIYNDYIGGKSTDKIFDYNKFEIGDNIVYPYIDGKYDFIQLKDNDGIFYIVHPNEEDFQRDIDNNNYKIIEPRKKYINKVEDIFNYLKIFKVFDENNNITVFGNNILKLLEIFSSREKENKATIELNDLFYFLHAHSFIKYDIKLFNHLIHSGIIKWIFSNNKIILSLNKKIETKNDFISKSKLIPRKYYDVEELSYSYLKNKNPEIKKNIIKNNIDSEISFATRDNIKRDSAILTNKEIGTYLPVLIEYNKIKIKLQYIFENLKEYNLDSIQFNNNMFNLEKDLIFSYLLVKYYPENLLEKLKGIDIYQNFYNKDINNLYMIYILTYENGKTRIMTNVKKKYMQFIIYLTSKEDHNIDNIMYIDPVIFKYLDHPIITDCGKLLKDDSDTNEENKNTIEQKFLIEKINPDFKKYIYDIIKNNT